MNDFMEQIFWELIEASKKASISVSIQVEQLTLFLSGKPKEIIVEFEILFRKKLLKLLRREILGVLKIILSVFSHDDFIYFGSWIILQGKDFYNKILDEPDFFATYSKTNTKISSFFADNLISVADNAYLLKHHLSDEDIDEIILPSDVGVRVAPYMSVDFEPDGWPMEEADLKSIFRIHGKNIDFKMIILNEVSRRPRRTGFIPTSDFRFPISQILEVKENYSHF